MTVIACVGFIILAGLFGALCWVVFVPPVDDTPAMPADVRARDRWRQVDR